jgi:hypothetical protein
VSQGGDCVDTVQKVDEMEIVFWILLALGLGILFHIILAMDEYDDLK